MNSPIFKRNTQSLSKIRVAAPRRISESSRFVSVQLVVGNENCPVNLLQPPWPPKDGIHVRARSGRATDEL
ncbi:hypothetical protein COP2_024317 [Malus domestica]